MNVRNATASFVCAVAMSAAAPSAFAQSSNIAPAHKYAWGENVGFINCRDAGSPSAAQGVRINATYLQGFAWGENIGWINFGDGAPDNGVSYANPTGGPVVGTPDFGVNRDLSTGHLSGYAWGENVGWINFAGGALATPAQPARIDNAAHRVRGYAWGENIGWINLDDANVYVGTCAADYNGNGTLEVADIFAFLNGWFAGSPLADFNGGGLAVDDIFAFLNAWFAGC